MLQFFVKAITYNKESSTGSHLLYIFNEEKNILIPISVAQRAAQALISARLNRVSPRPDLYDTTVRMLKALNSKVDKVIINHFNCDIFYAYLCIHQGEACFDIDAKVSDALIIASRFDAPIYVEENVIDKVGIRITAEDLESL